MHGQAWCVRWMTVAAALGFLAVALGAFGAHALEDLFASVADGARRREWWKTAVDYHFWHALLVVGVALAHERSQETRALNAAAALALVGIVLFSGSLYAMTLSGVTLLGLVTPFGGLAFLGAWLALGKAAFSSSNRHT